AAELAQYYPSVGGQRDFNNAQLPHILRQTILARRDALAPFVQTATVQTNETARGVCWLLPLLYTSWDAVHLVDLGASAGLNLVAEARNYRIFYGDPLAVNGNQFFDVGGGQSVQFPMQTQGPFRQPPTTNRQPQILSRTGCDLAPFRLETAADEQTLAAYIWADQPQRLERLREGLAAFHQTDPPVQLHPVRLPNELPEFLATAVPLHPNSPVVIYNTNMTVYLDDKGRSFQQHIANWATTQKRPVLWIQWEPLWDGPQPPEYAWVAWTADLWQAGRHHRWHLAWNHPHGTAVHWLSGLHNWAAFWQETT
ncbi:MAG: DUF2332 domain-containing protein, partial [Ardenticatenaceae bacterium]|nr:DUF2332 domain-containing protein [Ardenticatenaceae bacterium]